MKLTPERLENWRKTIGTRIEKELLDHIDALEAENFHWLSQTNIARKERDKLKARVEKLRGALLIKACPICQKPDPENWKDWKCHGYDACKALAEDEEMAKK